MKQHSQEMKKNQYIFDNEYRLTFQQSTIPPAGLWQCLTQATSDRCRANCMCAVAMKR